MYGVQPLFLKMDMQSLLRLIYHAEGMLGSYDTPPANSYVVVVLQRLVRARGHLDS